MKQKCRSAISLVLCAALVAGFGVLPAHAGSTASVNTGAKQGVFAATATVDPATSGVSATPGALSYFGVGEDGKVWADKSVTPHRAGTPLAADGTLDVTLSTLGQQYVTTTSTVVQGSRSTADVVLILDVTGSMEFAFDSNDKPDEIVKRRSYAMVQAANAAIRTVMEANANNRVCVTTFANKTASTLIPLGSYLPSDLPAGKDYLTYTSAKITPNVGGKGAVSVTGGTNTQTGIAYGAYQLYSQDMLQGAVPTGEKKFPFVLFLTDGVATSARSNWYGDSSGNNLGSGEKEGFLSTAADDKTPGNSGSTEVNALTILTAAYQKDKITEAYQKYNQDETIGTTWFSVGIALDDSAASGDNIGRTMMDPQWSNEHQGDSKSASKGTIDNIGYYTTGKYASSVPASVKARNYGAAPNYYYPTAYEENGVKKNYITFAQTPEVVSAAFNDLGTIISNATSTAAPPITSSDSSAQGGGAVRFTDTLGASMEIKGVTVSSGGKSYALAKGGDGKYANAALPGLTLGVSGAAVTCEIPAELLPLYRFKNGKNSSGGYTPADPIRVTYNVELSAAALNTEKASCGKDYSASFLGSAWTGGSGPATATFTPTSDNPYYYYTSDKAGAVGTPGDVLMDAGNYTRYFKGTPVGEATGALSRVYVTAAMATADESAFASRDIGTLKDLNTSALNAAAVAALKATIMNCQTAAAGDVSDTSAVYAFQSGIPHDTGKSESKSSNATDTASTYYSRGPITAAGQSIAASLGNNGKISLVPWKYTVSLDTANGGPDKVIDVIYGENMPVVPGVKPTKPGSRFDGYQDADGNKYYDKDGNSTHQWDKEADNVTLYPVFIEICTITASAYYKNVGTSAYAAGATGGSATANGGGAVTVDKTGSVTLVATPATGYRFDGWFTTASGGAAASTSATYAISANATMTYNARFSQIAYTVTANAGPGGTVQIGGGTPGSSAGKNDATYGQSVTLTAAANPGYQFVGWSDNVTDATRTITVTGDTTLSAIFIKTGTISFDTVGGTPIDDIESVTPGAVVKDVLTANDIQTPTKPGWTFERWDKTDGQSGPSALDDTYTMPSGGLIVIARWTVDEDYPYRVGDYGYQSVNLAVGACEDPASPVFGQSEISIYSSRSITSNNSDALNADDITYGEQYLKDGYTITAKDDTYSITVSTGGVLYVGDETGADFPGQCNYPLRGEDCTCALGATVNTLSLIVNGGELYVDGQRSVVDTAIALYPANVFTFLSDPVTGNYFNATLLDGGGSVFPLSGLGGEGGGALWNVGDKVCTSDADDGDGSSSDAYYDEGYNLMGGRVKVTNEGITCQNDYVRDADGGVYNSMILVRDDGVTGMRLPFDDDRASYYDMQFTFDMPSIMGAVLDATSYNNGGYQGPASNNVYVVSSSGETLVLSGDTTRASGGGEKYYNFINYTDPTSQGPGASDMNNTIRLISATRVVDGKYHTVITAIPTPGHTLALSGPITLARSYNDDIGYESESVWLLDNIRADGVVTLEKDCYISVQPEKAWDSGETFQLHVDDPASKVGDMVADLTAVSADCPVLRFTLADNTGYRLEERDHKLYIALDDGSTVTGGAEDEDHNPLEDVKVSIWQSGEQQFGPVQTDSEGNFIFHGVPDGIYNLVIEHTDENGEKTTTTVILIVDSATQGGTVDTGKIMVPIQGRKNTLFQPSGVPANAVADLDKIFESVNGNTDDTLGVTTDDMAVVESGGIVVVTLTANTVGAREDQSAQVAGVEGMARTDSKTIGLKLDLTPLKNVKTVAGEERNTVLKQLNNLVTVYITLPAEAQGRSGYVVYRSHDGETQRLTETPNDDGEYFTVTGSILALSVKKFSVYAIAYDSVQAPPAGGGAATYPVKGEEAPGGSWSSNVKDTTPGSSVTIITKPEDGYTVGSVVVKDKNGNKVPVVDNGDGTFTFVMPSTEVTVSVSFVKKPAGPDATGVSRLLTTDDHILYLIGDDHGNFNPDDNMTRAEVAQMFYRLLITKPQTRGGAFSDVSPNAWYAEAVSAMAELGIVQGYEGAFRPNDNVTRAEFAAIAMRFATAADGSAAFTDVGTSHWAYSYIMSAAGYGWIRGYEDGTFRPESFITRAEVTTIVNHMLGRAADKGFVLAHLDTLKIFPDAVDQSYWAWWDIVEATNAHDFDLAGGSEIWTELP